MFSGEFKDNIGWKRVDISLNIFFLFFLKYQLFNYADNNNLYKSGKKYEKNKNNLVIDFMILHKWLCENHKLLSPGKCHHNVIGDKVLSHKII